MKRLALSIAILCFGCSDSEGSGGEGTIPLAEWVPTDRNQTGTPSGESSETAGAREREERPTVRAGAGSEAEVGPERLAGDGTVAGAQTGTSETAGDGEAGDETLTLVPPGTVVEEEPAERRADVLEDCTGSDNYSRCVIQRFDEGRSARSCGDVQAVYAAYRSLGNASAAESIVATRDQRCGAEGAGEGGASPE